MRYLSVLKPLIFIVIAGFATIFFWNRIKAGFLTLRQPEISQEEAQELEVLSENGENIEVIAEGLNVPWDLVFLEDGDMLVTERPGTVTKVAPDGEKTTIFTVEEVTHTGEAGLLGIVLHPDFSENKYVYLYFTSADENGNLTNSVLRYKFQDSQLTEGTEILRGIAGNVIHDGGRMKFGPDGYLYIGTGDAGNADSAQDKMSLNGKILRIAGDGSVPSDNPFGNAVYSYGHRNVQGLDWDSDGQLWATEHGPSGFETGNDEINLIKAGQNYGWPAIRGTETRDGMVTPVIESGRGSTWAPAGMAYLDASLYFGGLRGSTLYKADLDGEKITNLTEHLKNEFGRIRAVVLGPDNFLYIATSNRDGRGFVNEGDDKIIRVNPASLD